MLKPRFIHIQQPKDTTAIITELHNHEEILDNSLDEITMLKRGNVDPQDTLRRSSTAAYVTAVVQQLHNYLYKSGNSITKDEREFLNRIVGKADKVLRENIVMQAKPPIDVIPFEQVPVRHSYSSYGRREQRWGYGLHFSPFNEEGNSLTLANMPPNYTQSIHNHKVSEYCLSVDSRTEGIYFPGGKRERIYTTKRSQILHFSATTPHTLKNPLNKYARNITFKQASALVDWRPISRLNNVKRIRARIMKGKVTRINENQTTKEFVIDDRYYHFKIKIIRLDKDSTYENVHHYDQFIFVMNGRLDISHQTIMKSGKKNDFIVIDKNTPYSIHTHTFCRLYTVKWYEVLRSG